MNFRNGYLGACIVVLGVVMTIVLGYALSIEVSDEQVTKYSYVADLNGLFDSEQSPTYIEYNPSTNYTGYYTDQSILNGNTYFAGSEYLKYDTSGKPNVYRLNLAPDGYDSGTTTTLSGTSWDSGSSLILMPVTENANTGNLFKGTFGTYSTGTNATLSSVISELTTSMSIPAEVDVIYLSSVDGLDALEEPVLSGNGLTLDWVVFSVQNMWYDTGSRYSLRLQTTESMNQFPEDPQFKATRPILSCGIDLKRNSVQLFYDKDWKNPAGTYQLNDVVVSFGGTGTGATALHLGTTCTYWYGIQQDPSYLDIRGGVSIKEVPE